MRNLIIVTTLLATLVPAAVMAQLPDPGLTVAPGRTALVITDPQNDFLSPEGVTWGVVGESVTTARTPLSLDGFENSGADWLEQYKPLIADGKTVVTSPHKVYGPESNDLALQLRKRGIDKVILAGMSANLCMESHLRELLEQGFEVAVVKDATAGAKLPELDGYQAALVNFRFLANAVWTTADATRAIEGGGAE